MDCIMHCSLGDNTIYLELSMIWRRDRSLAERENMQHRGSSDSRATADSHCAAQGSRNEMETSRQRSCRDVLLIWLVKLQERVKRVDAFVRDIFKKKIGSGKQFSVENFHFFAAGKLTFLGGGYNFKTG